jgi:hypothetical protein
MEFDVSITRVLADLSTVILNKQVSTEIMPAGGLRQFSSARLPGSDGEEPKCNLTTTNQRDGQTPTELNKRPLLAMARSPHQDSGQMQDLRSGVQACFQTNGKCL